jgi:hypothetical protein
MHARNPHFIDVSVMYGLFDAALRVREIFFGADMRHEIDCGARTRGKQHLHTILSGNTVIFFLL